MLLCNTLLLFIYYILKRVLFSFKLENKGWIMRIRSDLDNLAWILIFPDVNKTKKKASLFFIFYINRSVADPDPN